ncbi:unnamed protein product, partial [Rotaria sp. Silwood2]
MSDTVLYQNISTASQPIYKAINDIEIYLLKKYILLFLIELNSKRTSQEKIHSILVCKSFIEDAIRDSSSSSSSGIKADGFLPALIFIVLKGEP